MVLLDLILFSERFLFGKLFDTLPAFPRETAISHL